MRKPQRLADVLDIDRVHYHFVQRRSSLRFGGKPGTRALWLREIFLWQRPTSPPPAPALP
jgi:hypothetical protein